MPAPSSAPDGATDRVRTRHEMEELERTNLRLALERAGWKISGAGGAAQMLGMSPSTLTSRLEVLGIAREKS